MNTSLKSILAATILVAISGTSAIAAVPNQSIQGAVRSALSGGNVNVVLKDGVATVHGYVQDVSEKNRVLAAVRKFEGVDKIHDLVFESN